MMKPIHFTYRQMHLEEEWEMPYYKPEVAQAAKEIKHQTTAYSDQLPLLVRTCQKQKKDNNIEREALGI